MTAASGHRAVARCDILGAAPYSSAENGLFRAFLTPAHAASLQRLTDWMVEAGMSVQLDPAGNLIGRYDGVDPAAPPLLIGSHIDSVHDAGRYDGPLGILLGVEAVAALKDAGRRMPFPIEVIAFGDEEGSRFPASMLCSRALAGTLEEAAMDVADGAGVPLVEALSAFPGAGGRPMRDAAHGPAIGFLEPHIEQGPVLEAEGLALGVVSGIAAQVRMKVEIRGVAGHAGTNAMGLRRDALAGAAEAVGAVERLALEAGGDVVATVGRMIVEPGAVNVVPGLVAFSIDVRASADEVRDETAAAIVTEIGSIAARRGLGLVMERVQALPAAPCDPVLSKLLQEVLAETGQRPRVLVSGAGHDAMVMSALCPTAMLFIRCEGGVSHNPAEAVTGEDADAALAVMARFIDKLGEIHA